MNRLMLHIYKHWRTSLSDKDQESAYLRLRMEHNDLAMHTTTRTLDA
jgi:hypothetical protein